MFADPDRATAGIRTTLDSGRRDRSSAPGEPTELLPNEGGIADALGWRDRPIPRYSTGMRSRWISPIALAATVALGACEKRKTPAAEVPVEAKPAENVASAVEPTGAEPAAAEPAATKSVRTAGVDATAAIPDDGKTRAGDAPSKSAPSEAQPSKAEPSKGDQAAGKGGKGKCGGIAGFRCPDKQKCRYARSKFEPPHPDAMGACVAETYCDAPPDCEGLMHVMTVGKWACVKKTCAWKTEGGSSAPQ